ncbi:MAG: hypothetical protein B7X78_09760, partial [Sphingomonadales bacterium 39-62-4]
AFLPARYPGSEAATSAAIRLGRQTEWAELGNGDAALEVGLGQRLWSLSDGEDTGLLDLRKLTFD